METAKISAQEINTDHDLLKNIFGAQYFVLLRIKDKVTLSLSQKEELIMLIEERNHFAIWAFVRELRK